MFLLYIFLLKICNQFLKIVLLKLESQHPAKESKSKNIKNMKLLKNKALKFLKISFYKILKVCNNFYMFCKQPSCYNF